MSGADGTVGTERNVRWAATMAGYAGPVRLAHADSHARVEPAPDTAPADHPPVTSPRGRTEREDLEAALLAPGATRAAGAGNRPRAEDPDAWRTSFERDRDRILHATAFRRLAGKTQVFVFPQDHQRTRLTHALEVAQVAAAIARALRLNVALTEAIALGHDCGHGPGGHASEDALDPYVAGGFDHAPWGALVSLAPLNLCAETVDGIANHSWSRPAPSTPEGEVVSWADRIAYVCHDWEDAVLAGIVAASQLPDAVRTRCGERRSAQLGAFIAGVVSASLRTGQVGMEEEEAEALAAFRACNYERIYLRAASLRQGEAVVAVLRALVEHFSDRPHLITDDRERTHSPDVLAGSEDAVRAAVTYVAGMTDRFAFRQAVALLGWDPAKLPVGVDG
ncbi:MAG TPA: HD domain-containing protein [Acidimicrobiales bacterium]|nr:HD domain-containing protein [Acidimicrobiales bacterium]